MQTQFALNLELKKGRPVKQVIGSQFKIPVGPLMKCEYCASTDRHLKVSECDNECDSECVSECDSECDSE